MPLQALESLLESNHGGIWFLPNHENVKAVQALAKRCDYAFFHIEGRNITRKEQLLNHVATALHFPGEFGHNWDALEECLTDMEWIDAEGYLLYFDHIDGMLAENPDQFETFIEIARDAIASWKEDDTAMIVLLSGAKTPKGVSRLKEAAKDA